MKEDKFVLNGGRVELVGSQNVPHYGRHPDKIWLRESQWHLDLPTFSLIHDQEQIGTDYPVDPSVLLHTELAEFGQGTPEGKLVKSPTVTWFEVSNCLVTDPTFRFEFCSHGEKFEHYLAAAHCLEGYDSVTVTPRSGDKGRDIIAEQGRIRLLHEAKAYKPTRLVKAEQVRALYGVWNLDANATDAAITTTSDFAPRVAEEFARVMPDILRTVSGTQFVDHMKCISASHPATSLCAVLYAAAGVEIKPDQNGRLVPK